MKTGMILVFVVGLLGSGMGVTYAADSMAEKEASPTIKERLTKDTIKGILMNMEGEYYIIKDTDGKEHKIHIDKSTKLDKVVPGDRGQSLCDRSGSYDDVAA